MSNTLLIALNSPLEQIVIRFAFYAQNVQSVLFDFFCFFLFLGPAQ